MSHKAASVRVFLYKQCKGRENKELYRFYMLTWNSSHEFISHDGARYFLENMLSQYGISSSELKQLFRTYKISPKIAEIFTK